MQQYYLKYKIQYNTIFDNLRKLKKKKINFYIDLLSITTGLYNKRTILMEIDEYVRNKKVSNLFLTELKDFLNTLFVVFKQFDPYFIIFYDDGLCNQNRNISSSYKDTRSPPKEEILYELEQYELFKVIKKYYFNLIQTDFHKPDTVCTVIYLNEYETDLIPHYCIKNNIFDSLDSDILNVILSKDKDLLQTLQFNNTIMCATRYIPSLETKLYFGIYNDENAFEYVYKKFKRGILTSKYIPLFLAICGDISDGIKGVKGYGPAKTIQLLQNNNIPHILNTKDINQYPKIIQDNFEKIQNNFKLTSFDEQISRIPNYIFESLF